MHWGSRPTAIDGPPCLQPAKPLARCKRFAMRLPDSAHGQRWQRWASPSLARLGETHAVLVTYQLQLQLSPQRGIQQIGIRTYRCAVTSSSLQVHCLSNGFRTIPKSLCRNLIWLAGEGRELADMEQCLQCACQG